MNKTAIVTPTWLNEPEYYKRCDRWAKYHITEGRIPHGWDVICLDNASRFALPYSYRDATRIRFRKEYLRTALLEYPYAWRAFYMLGTILRDWEYERVIFVESDFFVCSEQLIRWAERQEGLVALWTHQYGFPESAFTVLTKCEAYDKFVAEKTWQERTGVMEHIIPWTHVEKSFLGDRCEGRPRPQSGIDFAAQLRLEEAIPQWHAI